VRIKEKAQMQAQKKKEAPKSKALKSLLAQNKTPAKPKTALNKLKKQVCFIGSDKEEGVVLTLAKSTSRGCVIKL